MTYTWLFELNGEDLDLRTIAELFSDSFSIFSADEKWFLSMQLEFPPDGGADARAAVEPVLARLNASAQVAYGNHENIRLGRMMCMNPTGAPATQIVSAAGMRSQFRPGGGKLVTDCLLTAIQKDDHFARALYLFGVLPQDWRGLSVVLDVVEEGNGGERGLKSKQWVAGSSIDNFGATANSFKAIGHQARHGYLSKGVDARRQTLEEARSMIRTILERWAKELI